MLENFAYMKLHTRPISDLHMAAWINVKSCPWALGWAHWGYVKIVLALLPHFLFSNYCIQITFSFQTTNAHLGQMLRKRGYKAGLGTQGCRRWGMELEVGREEGSSESLPCKCYWHPSSKPHSYTETLQTPQVPRLHMAWFLFNNSIIDQLLIPRELHKKQKSTGGISMKAGHITKRMDNRYLKDHCIILIYRHSLNILDLLDGF